MKAVYRSIKPYWLYLILIGKKRIEVGKTFPKAEDWNKEVFLHCSKDMRSFKRIPEKDRGWMQKYLGKCACKFVCDRIDDFYCASIPYRKENNLGYGCFIDNGVYKVDGWHEGVVFERSGPRIDTMLKNTDLENMCLSAQEIFDYIGIGKHLYGWNISDLKIYDKPMELGEFYTIDNEAVQKCEYRFQTYYNFTDTGYIKNGFACSYKDQWCDKCKTIPLTRPPQSWCYVEVQG